MKKEGELRNQLKAVRTRLGLSQQDLATAAGVAQQTIGGIESGTYALSLTVALHLAKTLGCPVEELFWLEQDAPTIKATPLFSTDTGESIRVALAQVSGRWVASPLVGEQSTRREMIPADGVGSWDTDGEHLAVQLLDTPEVLAQTLFVAGCTPALSLWIRSAERWHPGLRVHWLHASSMAALTHLGRENVHLAGVHLFDPVTGEDNLPFVQKALPNVPTVLVNLGTWEEGLLVASGNPKRLQSGPDMAQGNIRLINREIGAGSRALLDWFLAQDGVPTSAVTGYDTIAGGHLDVAQAIRTGAADVGVSTASVAQAYGLDFLPLRSVRYDLALRKETLALPPIQQLLGTLHHRWVRSQLTTLGGYDTTHTGEITEVGE